MIREQYTDQQLITAIRSAGTKRSRALKYLYHNEKYSSKVTEIVTKGGGNNERAKLVFENCIIQFDKLVRRQQYKAETLTHFFESQAKLGWCRLLITSKKAQELVLNFLTSDKELEGKIHALIIKNNGSNDDAQDMYQNGLILINTYMNEGKFRGGAVKGFFYQVCYNLWRNELKKNKTLPLPEDGTDLTISTLDPQEELERKERSRLLDALFKQLSESCQKILRLKFFIIDNYSLQEIAQQMGFKNAQIAANTLSKCRKRLWVLLEKQKPSFEWIRNI